MKQPRTFGLLAVLILSVFACGQMTVTAPAATTPGRMPGKVFRDCPNGPEMVGVPAGSFTMGSSAAEKPWAVSHGATAGSVSDESPQHVVSLRSFALGRYDVTREWKRLGYSAQFDTPVTHKGVEPLEQAYQDAISILSKNNSCSRFYGDTKAAEEVLGRLVTQFQIHLLRDSKTGIEMSGNFTYSDQTEEHAGYRLFAAATINTAGPFFKAKVFPAEPYVPPVGSFLPNTREARVLMLLHELAHLVKGQDGNWLIPDDGNIPALSNQNTTLIESQCRPQILSLSQKADERVAWNTTPWRSNWL
jgi:hypothetical protein